MFESNALNANGFTRRQLGSPQQSACAASIDLPLNVITVMTITCFLFYVRFPTDVSRKRHADIGIAAQNNFRADRRRYL